MIWLFAALLVLWGNASSWLLGATAALPGGSVEFVLAGAALVAISIAFTRMLGLDAAAVGLGRVGLTPGAAAGGALGLTGAMAAAVIPDELAFRGVLLGGLVRRLRQRDALIISGAAFALRHLGVAIVTVDDTTLGSPSLWFALAIAVALAAVLLGGSALAWLRLRTRSLATTIALHWVFNAGLLLGLSCTRVPAECCG